MITELITSVFIIMGSILCLITTIGLLRLPDLLTRMHSASIASTVGVGFLLLAVGIISNDPSIIARVIMAIIFLFITVPISTHLLARAACLNNVFIWEGTHSNEYRNGQKTQNTHTQK